jgi:hypothetical protein
MCERSLVQMCTLPPIDKEIANTDSCRFCSGSLYEIHDSMKVPLSEEAIDFRIFRTARTTMHGYMEATYMYGLGEEDLHHDLLWGCSYAGTHIPH